uniref:Uncharacterized protein n=1 Tax=Bionectria ochroleuca TaxID=29856 RepID=A0A8H7K2L5_BIOOC
MVRYEYQNDKDFGVFGAIREAVVDGHLGNQTLASTEVSAGMKREVRHQSRTSLGNYPDRRDSPNCQPCFLSSEIQTLNHLDTGVSNTASSRHNPGKIPTKLSICFY